MATANRGFASMDPVSATWYAVTATRREWIIGA